MSWKLDRNIIKNILLAFVVWSASYLNAGATTLVDFGNRTLDQDTGLWWLDVSLTNGLSVDAALAAFPSYRVADKSEVFSLFLGAGITAIDTSHRASDYAAATTLIDLLGQTFGTVGSGDYGTQGWAYNSTDLGGDLFREPFVSANDGGGTGAAYAGGVLFPSNRAISGVGVFLVQAIPLPAALPLFGTGLALLGVAGWRRRRAVAV